MIPYHWNKEPLQIKTILSSKPTVISIKGNLKSNSSLRSTYDKTSITLTINLRDKVIDLENYYTPNMKLLELPPHIEGEEVTWNLYKLKRKLVITCKGKVVWIMEYADLFDEQKFGSTVFSVLSAWEKDVMGITFTNEDTATLGYRETGGILNLISPDISSFQVY